MGVAEKADKRSFRPREQVILPQGDPAAAPLGARVHGCWSRTHRKGVLLRPVPLFPRDEAERCLCVASP